MAISNNLLTYLKKGNEEAYRELFYDSFYDLVHYANGILKNREAAEDVVQDLFVAFWYEKKYINIHSDLEGYLFHAVRNACIDYLRMEKRKNERLEGMRHEHMDYDGSSQEEGEEGKLLDELFRAIPHLPEQCKKIFTLCALEGLKYQEAADRLGVSINTVRTQMGRAYKSLRGHLSRKTFTTIMFFIFFKSLINKKL